MNQKLFNYILIGVAVLFLAAGQVELLLNGEAVIGMTLTAISFVLLILGISGKSADIYKKCVDVIKKILEVTSKVNTQLSESGKKAADAIKTGGRAAITGDVKASARGSRAPWLKQYPPNFPSM